MPFTRDEFLGVFAAYNQALWPVAVALWLSTALAVAGWMRGAAWGELTLRRVLGLNWLLAGVAYHAAFFARINPAAWAFAAMFVLQWWAMARTSGQVGTLASRAPLRRRHALGLAFIAYGLIYPALAWADGLRYPYAPTFGVPCPTTILTIGFLLASPTRSILESIVPIAWSVIGGSASWLFGVHADVALVAAGLVLALDLVGTARLKTGVTS